MTPRKTSAPKERILTPDEQRAATSRLEARITELRELDVSILKSGTDPAVESLEQRIRATLASIYGENSRQYARLGDAASLDATSYVLSLSP